MREFIYDKRIGYEGEEITTRTEGMDARCLHMMQARSPAYVTRNGAEGLWDHNLRLIAK